jgi:hypothetical protein
MLNVVMNDLRAHTTTDFLKSIHFVNSNITRKRDALPCEPHTSVLISQTMPKHYLNCAYINEVKIWVVEAASHTFEVNINTNNKNKQTQCGL